MNVIINNYGLFLYCSQERQHYRHRDLAIRCRKDYLSIIIDGMDQNKTNLPHILRERKSGSNLWRLRFVVHTCYNI